MGVICSSRSMTRIRQTASSNAGGVPLPSSRAFCRWYVPTFPYQPVSQRCRSPNSASIPCSAHSPGVCSWLMLAPSSAVILQRLAQFSTILMCLFSLEWWRWWPFMYGGTFAMIVKPVPAWQQLRLPLCSRPLSHNKAGDNSPTNNPNGNKGSLNHLNHQQNGDNRLSSRIGADHHSQDRGKPDNLNFNHPNQAGESRSSPGLPRPMLMTVPPGEAN